MLTTTKRILPIALVAALLGGSVGAFVMHAPNTPETANNTPTTGSELKAVTPATDTSLTNENLTPEQIAYRDGFEQGFLSAQNGAVASNYRAGSRTRSVSNNSGESYNHYTSTRAPQKRSFWQKHRDKLTVAAGTGGGALIGGLLGGKKGALIGGLAGAGGSALYTYKLRKRTPSY